MVYLLYLFYLKEKLLVHHFIPVVDTLKCSNASLSSASSHHHIASLFFCDRIIVSLLSVWSDQQCCLKLGDFRRFILILVTTHEVAQTVSFIVAEPINYTVYGLRKRRERMMGEQELLEIKIDYLMN